MHFPPLYAAGLLMPVSFDVSVPNLVCAPVASPPVWAPHRKGGSPLNHQWGILQFPLVSFFPGDALVVRRFISLCHFLGLAVRFLCTQCVAHLNSVHAEGPEQTKEPTYTWLLALGCCSYISSSSSYLEPGPVTVCSQPREPANTLWIVLSGTQS